MNTYFIILSYQMAKCGSGTNQVNLLIHKSYMHSVLNELQIKVKIIKPIIECYGLKQNNNISLNFHHPVKELIWLNFNNNLI